MLRYPVSVLKTGEFTRGAIHVELVELPKLAPEISALVEKRWKEELDLNPDLQSGELLSPLSVDESENKIVLRCGISDYKQFLGTTKDPDLPEGSRRRAIGVLAVTITSDGYVMLGVRSPRIDWGTLRHVVPAGRMKRTDGTPFDGVLNEFAEETAILESDLKSLICVGILQDETWGQHRSEEVFRLPEPEMVD